MPSALNFSTARGGGLLPGPGANTVYPLPLASVQPIVERSPVCVFFDTARPSKEQRFSLLFTKPRRIYSCRTCAEVSPLLEIVSEAARRSWIAGYLAYEAAYGLEERFRARYDQYSVRDGDLAWFAEFDEPLIFDHLTGAWNRSPAPVPESNGNAVPAKEKQPPDIRNLPAFGGYSRSIGTIKRLIASGDVYQVNYTYTVSVASRLRPWNLYMHLRTKQPVPFGAFMKTGRRTVVSLSPELFFMKQGRRISAKPMKGTAPRGRFISEDDAIAAELAADAKNRSENVMIVDLLRNDLGRICETGSVGVRRLFEVERHPTIHQMTSTVEGTLRRGVSFSAVINAMFPCGSVTGAPKLRAMEVIGELEKGERGVYCGAIGYMSPSGRSVFSVPIRTLQKGTGQKTWRYGAGSGIVWDSNARSEWRECRDKCAFLTHQRPHFRIFESLLFSKGAFLYLEEHRRRLFRSARYFGIRAGCAEWKEAVSAAARALKGNAAAHKVRIVLEANGAFSWDFEAIPGPPPANEMAAAVAISEKPLCPDSPFFFHKTTYRPWYEPAMNLIRRGACFDVLHFDAGGRLTEGARSNLFVTIEDVFYTPPVECGLLPGVLRHRLLKTGACRERVLFLKDLKRARAVYCGNSVRGLVRVRVEGKDSRS